MTERKRCADCKWIRGIGRYAGCDHPYNLRIERIPAHVDAAGFAVDAFTREYRGSNYASLLRERWFFSCGPRAAWFQRRADQ